MAYGVREIDIAGQQTRTAEQVEEIRKEDEQKGRARKGQPKRGKHVWSLEEIQQLYDAGATREQVDLITDNNMSELDGWAVIGVGETEPEGLDDIRRGYSQPGTEEPFDIATRGPTQLADPVYPEGYLDTLALIDELAYRAPSAEDLTYDAPTYGLDDLGLPQEAEAAYAEADPYARQTQRDTLGRLRSQLLETGLGAEDIAKLEGIQRQTEDARLTGGRGISQGLAGRGMAIGGEQVMGDLELANALRMASTEQEGGVISDIERRGRESAADLGQYGADFAQQTFREDFETGSAADRLARANAAATQGYQQDIAGLEQEATRWGARAPLKAQTLKGMPLDMKGGLARVESKARFGDQELAAAMERYNRSVEKQNGVSFWDWLEGGVGVVGGVVATAVGAPQVGVPAIAAGVGKTAGNIERELNPRPTIDTSAAPVYGHGQGPDDDDDDDDTYRWGR